MILLVAIATAVGVVLLGVQLVHAYNVRHSGDEEAGVTEG